jgi:hypothetical protein
LSDEDRKALIAELKRQPGFDVWRAWAHEMRETYFTNLAKALYAGTPITPEDLAFKRGYFSAMNRMFNEVDFSAKAINDDLEATDEPE